MEIIVHCSDSRFGNAATIDHWHRQRGFNRGIGYHAVILNGQTSSKCYHDYFDGKIESGRPFDDNERISGWETGAHAKGMNDRIGVCLIGQTGIFTAKQKIALVEFCKLMKDQFNEVIISEHSDHDPKKPFCAGLGKKFIKNLNYLIHEM